MNNKRIIIEPKYDLQMKNKNAWLCSFKALKIYNGL